MTDHTRNDFTRNGIHGRNGDQLDDRLDERLRLDKVSLDERAGAVLHRDLGDIAVTASGDGIGDDPLGHITINRTKRGISPFVPIIKTPTYSENSGTHTGYAVEIEDDESETGYRHVGNVSKNYLLLSNEEVRELAVEIAMQSGLPFKESRIFWDGSRFCHVVDFLGSDVTEEVEPGDAVGLSLITRSSYDKSWRYECALMGRRFVCDNGAISGEFFARVSFKHRTAGDDGDGPKEESWQQIVRQGMSVIERAPADRDRYVTMLRRLRSAKMTDPRLREVWTALPTVGDSIKGQIMSRYVEHEEPTLFGLFQAGTWLFSHREKMTAADFQNNDAFTSSLLRLAEERLN
jgi:hypothetical protein